MAADKDATALIIGGGMSGLTAAIALRHAGIDCQVFEQVDDVHKTEAGAGLALGYNVARAFRHLGLIEELQEVAAPLTTWQFTTNKGRVLGTARISEDGELQQGIRRPDFHRFLVEHAGEENVQAGSKFVRFEQDDDGVTAHFADGRTARGDVLIGADGLKSAVRTQLLGESEPRYAGYCTRRGVVETDRAKEGLFRIILGKEQRFMFYPVGRWYMYWTAVVNEPEGQKEDPAERKRTVQKQFQGWPDPVEELMEGTDESAVFLSDVYDRDPVERWGEGRTTLLGDAAHPMTFDMGQGACQGIEGAVLLPKELKQGAADPAAALRAWEAERIPRTTKFVGHSRRIGDLGQTDKPIPRFVRNNVVARITTSNFGIKRGAKDLAVDY